MMRALRERRWQQVALTLATLFVSGAILAALLYNERDVLLTYDWDLQWRNLLQAMVVLIAGMLLAAFVWGDVMRTLGSRVAMGTHIRYYALSQLARRLPGTIWYVAGRGYLYRQHGDPVRLVTMASGLELIISVVSGALLTLSLAGFVLSDLPRTYLFGLAAAAGAGLIVMHPRIVRALLARIGLDDVPSIPYGRLVRWLLLYLVLWLVGGVVLFLIADAVYPLPVGRLPYFVASFTLVGTLSVLVFFLPSNFGFTEVGLSLLLSAVMPSSIAVLVAILNRILVMIFEMVGLGIVALIWRGEEDGELTARADFEEEVADDLYES